MLRYPMHNILTNDQLKRVSLKKSFLQSVNIKKDSQQVCFLIPWQSKAVFPDEVAETIYIILLCTHLYRFFSVSIHYLQCIVFYQISLLVTLYLMEYLIGINEIKITDNRHFAFVYFLGNLDYSLHGQQNENHLYMLVILH